MAGHNKWSTIKHKKDDIWTDLNLLRIILEMAEQGEFEHFYTTRGKADVRWWCRYTDKTYNNSPEKNTNIRQALADILYKAKNDPDPWLTNEQREESEKIYKIKIYIPKFKEEVNKLS